jgi:hypothetical protein
LWRRDKVFKTQFCNKLFDVVAQIITVTCGGGTRSSRPSSATNSLLLLLRSLQLLVEEGQGLQDPVLQQTLCCCCSDHYSYLWRRDKVFKTQFWCLVFQRRLYLYTVKKPFLVLASRQKIPVLRTENPALDTRTICLLPIEFFLITPARKATTGKSRPETTDTAGKSQPSDARKSRQVTTDTAGKFGCLSLQIQPENPGK